MTRHARRYRKVARRLSRLELMRRSMEEVSTLSAADLLPGPDPHPRFLDYYGEQGLFYALGEYGLLRALEGRGYRELALSTHATDERHTLVLSGVADGLPRTHLVELVVRRDRLVPDAGLPGLAPDYRVLTVDWLCLRHPLGRFTPSRPRLPGQDAPGLGLGEQVGELLERAVARLELDALVTVAEYFHNAVLYRRDTQFFDPHAAGRADALAAQLLGREGLSLAEASWAVEWGLVTESSGDVFHWRGEAQVWARDAALAAHLRSAEHAREARRAAAGASFTIDREGLARRWAHARASLEGS